MTSKKELPTNGSGIEKKDKVTEQQQSNNLPPLRAQLPGVQATIKS